METWLILSEALIYWLINKEITLIPLLINLYSCLIKSKAQIWTYQYAIMLR